MRKCPFPGCRGGCSRCGAEKDKRRDEAIYERTYGAYHARVMAEAFPEPRHDQEGNVGLLMKRMFMNKIVRESFDAGWRAAGKKVPER